ncbi:MAG: hypothetical protein ACTHJ7_00250 [Candidatus Nitrosocosmicus sp.]
MQDVLPVMDFTFCVCIICEVVALENIEVCQYNNKELSKGLASCYNKLHILTEHLEHGKTYLSIIFKIASITRSILTFSGH